MKYFIISGSPVYGFKYVGPFDSRKMAEEYQQENYQRLSIYWWVAELLAPDKKETMQ